MTAALAAEASAKLPEDATDEMRDRYLGHRMMDVARSRGTAGFRGMHFCDGTTTRRLVRGPMALYVKQEYGAPLVRALKEYGARNCSK